MFKDKILDFFEELHIKDSVYGRYRYAACQTQPILYASIYAVLARHMLGDIGAVSPGQKREWIDYLQSFQAEDGFFKDEKIAHPGSWYVPPHMEWCGWWHLSSHAIMALTALDTVAARELVMLKPFYDEKLLRQWLAARDPDRMDFVGNEILNLGQLLQYARDFQNVKLAGRAMEIILDWLDETQDKATGMWGQSFVTSKERNKAYQGAYHFFLLYDYDRRPIQYPERIINFMLSMQTAQGGFGIHENTSGCEDIDAIDPLARLYFRTSYRHADIELALHRAFDWVLQNWTPDGGFAFIRNREMFYGSRLMYSGPNEGSSFATWWRMLSLAIMSQVIKNHALVEIPWQFLKCPGYQIWRESVPST
jgi:prenyltransferase beta subunit